MDEDSLVNTDVDLAALQRAAARLSPLLQRDGLLHGDALIARDEMRHAWSVLLPRHRDTSQKALFRRVNQLLDQEQLEAPLDAFTIVDYDDPGFLDMSHSAISPPARYQDFGVVAEISGRLFSDALRIAVDPADFERYVMEAMTSVFPGRTQVEAIAPLQITSAAFPRTLARLVDFSLEYQGKLLMVETKATRRPLPTRHVLAAYGALAVTREKTGWNPFFMLVSMSGFTEDALELFRDSPNFALVTWSYGADAREFYDVFGRMIGE